MAFEDHLLKLEYIQSIILYKKGYKNQNVYNIYLNKYSVILYITCIYTILYKIYTNYIIKIINSISKFPICNHNHN